MDWGCGVSLAFNYDLLSAWVPFLAMWRDPGGIAFEDPGCGAPMVMLRALSSSALVNSRASVVCANLASVPYKSAHWLSDET